MKKNRKTNQFFIVNGTQLINAIELIHHFGIEEEDNQLLLMSISDKVRSDMSAVIKLYKWSGISFRFPNWIITLKSIRLRTFLSFVYFKLRSKAIFHGIDGIMVFGNYQNPFCKYSMKIGQGRHQVIIDDGPGSIDFRLGITKVDNRLKNLLEMLLGTRKFIVQPDVFFTSYIDDVRANNKSIEIQNNSFKYLKSLMVDKVRSKQIYFIGFPFVEERGMNLQEYLTILKEVINIYPNITYVAHRREREDTLEAIRQLVYVRRLGVPFELYLIGEGEVPERIIGFFTTIFFNVNRMFGNTIQLEYIQLVDFKTTHYKDLALIYERISRIAKKLFVIDPKS